ncbi:hypothetical protein [Candidatus Palauibacter sp.]|uniref:hypothetical protein n=1 Tax=Candidatus Palauibacter sp. TaxID=3101350 RepID=UPI003B0243B3
MKRLTVFLMLALVACTEGNPSAPALPAIFGVAPHPPDELGVLADTHLPSPAAGGCRVDVVAGKPCRVSVWRVSLTNGVVTFEWHWAEPITGEILGDRFHILVFAESDHMGSPVFEYESSAATERTVDWPTGYDPLQNYDAHISVINTHPDGEERGDWRKLSMTHSGSVDVPTITATPTATGATIAWATSQSGVMYVVERKNADADTVTWSPVTTTGSPPSLAVTVLWKSVLEACFRVIATASTVSTLTATSNEVCTATDSTLIVVPPLRITPSATSIRVNWAYEPRFAFRFSIERSDDGDDWRDISNSLPLDANQVSWSDVQEVCYRSVSQVGDATETSVLRVCARTPEPIVVPNLQLTLVEDGGAVTIRWDTLPAAAFTFSIERQNDGGLWTEVSTSLPIVDLVDWSKRVEVCYRSVSQVGGGVAQTSDPPKCTGTSETIESPIPNLTARALLDTRSGSSTMVEVDWLTVPVPAFTFTISRADGTTATSLPFRDEVDWSTTLEVCYQATASNDSTSNSVCVGSPIEFVIPDIVATTQPTSTDGTLTSSVLVNWVTPPTETFAYEVSRYNDGVVSSATWTSLPVNDALDWSGTVEACYQVGTSDGTISNPACVTMPFVMPPLSASGGADVITVEWAAELPSFTYRVQMLDAAGEWVHASTSLPYEDQIGYGATGCYQVIADRPAGFTSPMVCATTTGLATNDDPELILSVAGNSITVDWRPRWSGSGVWLSWRSVPATAFDSAAVFGRDSLVTHQIEPRETRCYRVRHGSRSWSDEACATGSATPTSPGSPATPTGPTACDAVTNGIRDGQIVEYDGQCHEGTWTHFSFSGKGSGSILLTNNLGLRDSFVICGHNNVTGKVCSGGTDAPDGDYEWVWVSK